MKTLFSLIVVFLFTQPLFAQDTHLPDVENVRLENDMLVWDAQDVATGYNIYKDYGYYTTVRGSTSFQLTEPGTYRVSSFDDNGTFGRAYGTRIEYTGSDPDTSVSYSYVYGSQTLLVYKTCKNVMPGESCVAICPWRHTPDLEFSREISLSHMSGGACSTSDIVEADGWIGHRSYSCTVPTFSGEVVAQAICVKR
jgi:hypothetical protein